MHLPCCQVAAGQVFPAGACLHEHSWQLCLPATVMTTPGCMGDVVSCLGAAADAHACMSGQPRAKLYHFSALLQVLGQDSRPAPPPTRRLQRGSQAACALRDSDAACGQFYMSAGSGS